jgi:uncharacterized membrane protein
MNFLKHKFTDKQLRTLSKMVSWRVVVSATNMLSAWYFSGDWRVGLGVVGVALIVNSTIYFFHERVWNLIDWGRSANE